MIRRPPRSTRTDTLFPYTTLFRSLFEGGLHAAPRLPKVLHVRSLTGIRIMGKTRLAGLAWAAAGLLLATAGAVDAARPYQVDDLLLLADLGAAQFSPDGKRMYFEHFPRLAAHPGFTREVVGGPMRP